MLDLRILYGFNIEIKGKVRRAGRCHVRDLGIVPRKGGEYKKTRTLLTEEMKKRAKPTAVHLLKQGQSIRFIYNELHAKKLIMNEAGNYPGYNAVCQWLRWIIMDYGLEQTPLYRKVEELQEQGKSISEIAQELRVKPVAVRRARQRIKKHLTRDQKPG